MDPIPYLRERRRTIFWDEHLWYAHLLVLFLAKDHVAWGPAVFAVALVYGAACMAWSYVFYWRLERRLLLDSLLREREPEAAAPPALKLVS